MSRPRRRGRGGGRWVALGGEVDGGAGVELGARGLEGGERLGQGEAELVAGRLPLLATELDPRHDLELAPAGAGRQGVQQRERGVGVLHGGLRRAHVGGLAGGDAEVLRGGVDVADARLTHRGGVDEDEGDLVVRRRCVSRAQLSTAWWRFVVRRTRRRPGVARGEPTRALAARGSHPSGRVARARSACRR
jgi:hypothetical protein